MKKETLTFLSACGETNIHAVRWTPDGEVKAVLQIVHGMAEYIDRYEPFAEYLTERGFVVTGDNHLGHGETGKEQGIYGYFCEKDPATVVVEDVHKLRQITQELYPDVPYFVMGHSMGSFIARNYMFAHGTGLAGMVVMGTGHQAPAMIGGGRFMANLTGLFKGQKGVAKLVDKMAFGTYLKRINNPKTSFDWLTTEDLFVEKYIADEWCGFTFTVNGFKTLFELLTRLNDSTNLAKVPKDLPLFFVAGEEDPVGEYGEAVKKAVKTLKDAGVSDIALKLYPGDRHEILNEKDRAVVMEDVYKFLEAHI